MKRFTFPFALCASALVGLAFLPDSAEAGGLDWLKKKSNLSEEPGTLNVEDLLDDPIRLRVLNDNAPIYYQVDMKRQLGFMARGTEVRIIALGENDRYKVRGKARHGEVSGWMRIQDMASVDPNFAENLRNMFARQKMVKALVEAHEVALGMTADEVQASIGRPHQKSSKLDAAGRQETFEYITYDKVPQKILRRDQFGRLYHATVYVKVETGRLAIKFTDGVVSSIEETEGNPLPQGGVKQVVPPINIF